jgi:hypothetical protein
MSPIVQPVPPDPEILLRVLPDGGLVRRLLQVAFGAGFASLEEAGGLRPFGVWLGTDGACRFVVPDGEVEDVVEAVLKALAESQRSGQALAAALVDDVWIEAEGTSRSDALRVRVLRTGRGELCALQPYRQLEAGLEKRPYWFDGEGSALATSAWMGAALPVEA